MHRLVQQAKWHMKSRLSAMSKGPSYNITASEKHAFTWFRIAKCGTRTLLSAFDQNCQLDMNGSFLPYYPKQHASRFKFCMVRNPWDRLVSCYADKVVGKLAFGECWGKDFDFFVRCCRAQDLDTCNRHIRRQTTLFPVADVDYVARFENFSGEFNYLMNEKLGLDVEITRVNPSAHLHYSTYYSQETMDIVAQIYADDIEFGDYSFGKDR